MRDIEEILKAKSIHTFACPFQFKAEFAKQLLEKLQQKGWCQKNLDFMVKKQASQDAIDCFMRCQYFSQSARDIFINQEMNICHVYEYPFDARKQYQYYVKKEDKDDKENKENKEFYLPIDEIELHIYSHGVGILFIRVLNGNYNVSDIKKINDYGRRTCIPYLTDKDSFLLCADELGIIIDKNIYNTVKFREMIDQYLEGTLSEYQQLTRQAQFLYDLLNCNLEHNQINDIEVNLLSDDRMFVCTIIRDTQLSKAIENKEYDEKELYPILFMDAKGATCQDKNMREQLYADAVYPRWLDWGTIYNATSYSLCCITTEYEGVNASVIRPFIIEYSYFVSLVLAQRIGIMAFADRAGNIVAKIGEGRLKRKHYDEIIDLQKQYIKFKNQILIMEVSTQEQGIEIYHLLQNQMLVKEEQEILNDQLQGLYEISNISMGNRFTRYGLVFAAIAILADLVINVTVVCVQDKIRLSDFILRLCRIF